MKKQNQTVDYIAIGKERAARYKRWEKLYRMHNDASYNVKNIYTSKKDDISKTHLSNYGLDECINIENIKEQGKYEYYLKQAYRMGYKPYRTVIIDNKEVNRKLNEYEKDQLVIYMEYLDVLRKVRASIHDERFCHLAFYQPDIYIKDCMNTNFKGDDNFVRMYDFAVRKACRILNDKGYKTYWSSANMEDASEERFGDVVKDKNVAYILIDPRNLTSDLKEQLLLNGSCEFWGIAPFHAEKENPNDDDEVGKYYGIWVEITSPDMSIDELSDLLAEKAIELPTLVNKHEIIREQEINTGSHRKS